MIRPRKIRASAKDLNPSFSNRLIVRLSQQDEIFGI
jgi:hypothetical protein